MVNKISATVTCTDDENVIPVSKNNFSCQHFNYSDGGGVCQKETSGEGNVPCFLNRTLKQLARMEKLTLEQVNEA